MTSIVVRADTFVGDARRIRRRLTSSGSFFSDERRHAGKDDSRI